MFITTFTAFLTAFGVTMASGFATSAGVRILVVIAELVNKTINVIMPSPMNYPIPRYQYARAFSELLTDVIDTVLMNSKYGQPGSLKVNGKLEDFPDDGWHYYYPYRNAFDCKCILSCKDSNCKGYRGHESGLCEALRNVYIMLERKTERYAQFSRTFYTAYVKVITFDSWKMRNYHNFPEGTILFNEFKERIRLIKSD